MTMLDNSNRTISEDMAQDFDQCASFSRVYELVIQCVCPKDVFFAEFIEIKPFYQISFIVVLAFTHLLRVECLRATHLVDEGSSNIWPRLHQYL